MTPEVADRIRALRLKQGLSQRDVQVPGVSYAYVSRIEAHTRRPSIEALVALADKLGTTALFLLTGDKRGHCPVCQRGKVNGTLSIPNRDDERPNKG